MTLTTGIPRFQRLFRVFHQVRVLRMNEMPQIDIVLLESSEKPGGGQCPVRHRQMRVAHALVARHIASA